MKITLEDDEIRAALLDAAMTKIGWSQTAPELPDGVYFTITTPNGEVEDVESVEFTVCIAEPKDHPNDH